MKTINKILLIAGLVLATLTSTQAQINGPTSACTNSTYTYTIGDGSNYNWSAVGGQIIGSTTGASVQVKWTSPGTQTVTLYYYSNGSSAFTFNPGTGTQSSYSGTGNANGSGNGNGGVGNGNGNGNGVNNGNGNGSGGISSGGGIAAIGGGGGGGGSWVTLNKNVSVGPTIYSMTGGGSFCSGGSGVFIGMADSESGVTYQLKRNGTNVGSPINGTGANLSYGNQTVGGTYTVVASKTGCSVTMSGSKTVTVNSLPSTPPTPTITNNCGSTVLTRSNPASGYTYYWQSSSSGTSTSNTSTSVTRTSGTVYYLRSRNNSTQCWSAIRTVNYSINSVPSIPGTPIVTNNCGNTVLTRSNPPSGHTFYWQSSTSGTSTSNSSATITRTSGTIYYIRSRNNSSGCWSTAKSVSYSINANPSTPPTPSITNNCGSTVLTRANPSSGYTYYWQSSSGGTSTSNASTSVTRTSGTAYYLRSRNNSTGCWSTARTVNYSINTVPSTPATPTVTNNCGNTVLTRATPPSGYTYYWQSSSSGTSTSLSPLSVTRTSGTVYYLRSRNNSTSCWSASRSVSYSINAVPSTPPTPAVANNCGNTVLTRANPPSGYTYYWQSSSGGTSTSSSSTTKTRTSGTVYYLRSRNNSTLCWSSARTVNYSINTVPSTPATPTVTNNCGNTVLTRATPPSGYTYYWQSSSGGTSTSSSSTTKTRTSGTVYYLRSRNNSTLCWSSARSVSYSINAVPATPPTPIVANNCGSTDLTRATPPSGFTYYWQSSSGGTSTSSSSATKNRTSGSVYYLRSRNNSTLCWSSARSVSYSINTVPATPATPAVTNNCGNTVLTRTNPPSGYTYYWQSSSGGTSTSSSSTTKTRTSGSVYYLRSRNNSTLCWSSARSVSYSINAVPSTPPTPTVANNCGSTVLTRATPPSGFTYYWQGSSGGTSTSSSSTTKTRTSGTVYYLRSRNNSTLCWSSARSVSYSINAVPSTPPTPSVANNCGSTDLTRATPPSGFTYYWQSSSGGTSTSSSSATKNRTSGSVYYLRSRNNSTLCWSSARSVSYSINTVPATPATPTVSNNCGSTDLTRATPPSGFTYYWQSTSSGTSTSNSSVTKNRTSGTSYYLRSRNNSTLCWSAARIVSYSINAVPSTPPTPTVNNNCGSTDLTRATPPSGFTYYWQSSSGGTSTSNSSVTKNRTSGTVYYLRSRNNSTLCWSSARSVSYSINAVPATPPTPSITNNCGNTVLTRATPPSNHTYYWQSSSSGTSTSNSSSTVSRTSGTTYYLRSRHNTTNCWGSSRSVSYSIDPVPGLAGGSNNARCGIGTVSLTATIGSNGNNIRWYSAASGGTLLHTGTTYAPSVNNTTTYYAATYNSTTGCQDTDRKAITATVDPIPGLAGGSNSARCGTGTVTLTATTGSNGNNIRWYTAASGGSILHTGTSYTTPSISSSTTYYAASYNSTTGCQDTDRKAITATINPTPGLAGGSNSARCGTGAVTLTATTGSNGNNIRWYSASSGGSALHTGTSYTTPSISSSTTYYAATYNSTTGCQDTDRKAITATVNPIPGLAGGSNSARCGTGTVTLTATTGSNGNNIRWYAAASGGSILHTGTSYTTPSISSSTTYYAATYNSTTGCQDTDRKAITATINAYPTTFNVTGGGVYCAGGAGIAIGLSDSQTGVNYQLKRSSVNVGSPIAGNGSAISFGNQTIVASNYQVVATNATTTCSQTMNSTASVTTDPVSVGGTTTGGGTFCASASGTITLSGHVGTIQSWELSTNGGSSWSTVGSAAYSHSTAGTYIYKAIVKSGVCSTAESSTTSVVVEASTVGGTVSGSTTACVTGSSTLTLNGATGSVLNWEQSTNEGETWSTINSTATSLVRSGVTQTTAFRAIVQNGTCPSAISGEAVITIDAASVGGTTSGGGTYCASGSGNITLSGETGNVEKWQTRTNGGTWIDIVNTTNTQGFNQTTAGTYDYRAVVGNGLCSVDQSSVSTVVIDAQTVGGSVLSGGNASITVCQDDVIAFSLSGHTGSVLKWQSRINGGSWQDIVLTSTTYSGLASLINTTEYRAEVKNASCASAFSQPITVVTLGDLTAADLTVTQTLGVNPVLNTGIGTLSVNNAGTVQWQQSANDTTYTDISGETALTYNYSITTSTYFRARVTGQCNTTYSDPIFLEVKYVGTITGPTQAAYGEEVTIDLTGNSENASDWEVSFDNGTTYEALDLGYNIGNGEGTGFNSYKFTILETTMFKAKVDLTGIGIEETAPITVTVDESATPQTNYRQVQSTTLLVKEDDESQIPTSGSGALTQVSYLNGFGAPIKTVAVNSTPLEKDVVSFNVYNPNDTIQRTYMPFVTDNGLGANIKLNDLILAQDTFYTAGQSDIANSNYAFAEVRRDASPQRRVLEQGAPGADWQLSAGHTVEYDFRVNTISDSVRVWKPDGTSDALYAAEDLIVREMIDENEHVSLTFTDKAGRTILQKRESDNSTWITTGYVYDLIGRLKYTISPEGMNQIPTTGAYTPSASFIDQWVYSYIYDERGRLVEKKLPGKAIEYLIYDELDRLVLSQDGILRASNQWTYVKYDQRHRPIMTGLYTDNDSTKYSAMQAVVDTLSYDNGTDLYYEERDSTQTHAYSNQVFPMTNTEVLSVTYYDDYDIDADGTADYSYTTSGLSPEPAPLANVRGLSTATKIKVMDDSLANPWLTSVVFYDKYGRTIQARADNHLGGFDQSTTVYDFNGRALTSRTLHSDNTDTITINGRNTYDHAGRLLKSFTQIDSDDEIETAAYTYNELGQVVAKEVHSADSGANYLQKIDYGYTIRGWLKNINDPGTLGEDYFGMELYRNESLNALSQDEDYNGNITAIKWGENVGAQTSEQKAYAFQYDAMDRLTTAAYGEGSSFGSATGVFDEKEMTYDANGNMKSLDRYAQVDDAAVKIDDLSYTYTSGNQLNKVDDTAIGVTKDMGLNDSTGTDYLYDVNGNVIQDNNKDIDTIMYNYMNKPLAIVFNNSDSLRYTYSAAGTKLSVELFKADTLNKKTDYSGAFEYLDGSLDAISTGEGRIVKNLDNGEWEHQYHLTDHLGNVRVVYTDSPHTVEFTLNYENNPALPDDIAFFENVESSSLINNNLMDHTDAGSVYSYAQKLTGASGSTVGSVLTIPVKPGDKVSAEVYAKYLAEDPNSSNPAAAIATAVLGAISGNTVSTDYEGAINTSYQSTGSIITNPSYSNTYSSNEPMAFINLMFLPEQAEDSIATDHFAYAQVTDNSDGAHAILELAQDFVAPESGYVIVYLSNESSNLTEVYFDDLKVTLNETNIIQKNSYYPFGLQHSSSWSRVGRENKYQFNAASELNEETQNYEMFFRSYDPVIGRMSGVDPYADSYVSLSPYNYAANDPMYFNDPSGGTLMTPPERDQETLNGGGGSAWASAMERFGSGYGPSQSAMSSYARMDRFAYDWAISNIQESLDLDRSALSAFASVVLRDAKYSGGSWSESAGFQVSYTQLGAGLLAWESAIDFGGIDLSKLSSIPGLAGAGTYSGADGPASMLRNVDIKWSTNGTPTRSVFDDEPDGFIPIYSDLERAAYWAERGDVSRTALYTASAGSDVFLAKALVAGGLKLVVRGVVKNGKWVEVTKQANDIIRATIKNAKQLNKGFESGRHHKWMKDAARDLFEQAKISKLRGDLPELWQALETKATKLLQKAKGTGHKGGGVGSGY